MDFVPGRFHTTVLRSELKYRAKNTLRGRWGTPALVLLVYGLVSLGCGIVPLGPAILLPPLQMGLLIFFVRFYRYGEDQMENLFKGFDLFGKSLGVYWLSQLFIFLWSLLFIIPGIIASYSYSQAMLILHDNPDITVLEAIKRSKAMMYGNKLTLFIQDLSFIGWFILSIFPGFYIGFLWSMPYYYLTRIAFYENLLASAGYGTDGNYSMGYGNQSNNSNGYNNQGSYNAGYANQGYDNAGYGNQSNNSTGYNNQGSYNAGYGNQSNNSNGYNNQGSYNAGYGNQSNNSTGYNNQGSYNAGYGNQSNNSTGYNNQDYDNAGYGNQGNDSADDNQGNNSTGYDN